MMTALRKGLPELPQRIKRLPIDARGYPIPWFVDERDGVRDFRFASPRKRVIAVKDRRCWVCGDKLGRFLAFVVGPMCVVNRNTSEPPTHRECARFAVRACPFMLLPQAQYRKANMPEGVSAPVGHLDGNPGVIAIYVTATFKPYRVVGDEWLIRIGEPLDVEWYAQGRLATRAQVLEALERRLPLLEAQIEDGDEEGRRLFDRMVEEAKRLLPTEVGHESAER